MQHILNVNGIDSDDGGHELQLQGTSNEILSWYNNSVLIAGYYS